jgi:hypothetical protein
MVPDNTLAQVSPVQLLERLASASVGFVYINGIGAAPIREVGWPEHPSDTMVKEQLSYFVTLLELSRLALGPHGNLFIRAEERFGALMSIAAEHVMGRMNFRQEIIWPRPSNSIPQIYSTGHERLLWFGRTANSVRNPIFKPIHNASFRAYGAAHDRHGEYILNDLFCWPRSDPSVTFRDGEFEWRGINPPQGQAWRFPAEELDRRDGLGQIELDKFKPKYRLYRTDLKLTRPAGSIWDDLGNMEGDAGRSGVPRSVWERMILVATDPGALVVDPDCNDETMVYVADKLGRTWIAGCEDIDEFESLFGRTLSTGSKPNAILNRDFLDRYPALIAAQISVTEKLDHILPVKAPLKRFVSGQIFPGEEDIDVEFKEVNTRDNVSAVVKYLDQYPVAQLNAGVRGKLYCGIADDGIVKGVKLSRKERDELKQQAVQKLHRIKPSYPIGAFSVLLHPVEVSGAAAPDLFVVEIGLPAGAPNVLYANEKHEVYMKTVAGKQRLEHLQVVEEIRRRLA